MARDAPDARAAAGALRAARQDRAHRLRAPVRVRRRVSRRRRHAVGARPRLDHGGDGRRSLARDGAQPARSTHGIDARNPRTATRELPSGQLSVAQVGLFSAAALALFLIAVWQLAPKTHWLWPIPVAGFVIYPYLKRFTWLCHFWLGAVDGLAPVGAWVAITNHLPWEAWLLGAAVAFWVAGFDLFYALFDVDDRPRAGTALDRDALRRPRRVRRRARCRTPRRSRVSSRAGLGLSVGALYWIGVAAVAALLAYEHALVKPDDLRRLDAAFFTMNGVISVAFAVFVIADAVS